MQLSGFKLPREKLNEAYSLSIGRNTYTYIYIYIYIYVYR